MDGLGYKVKIKLLEQGRTQKSLADEIGISKQNLNNVLQGAKNLRLEHLLEHYIATGEVRKELYHGTN